MQQKTKQPVRFEVTDQTREALTAWIVKAKLADGDYLFPSRQRGSPHLSTRQYARIVKGWIVLLGGDPQAYGTHSLRRTKATLIYRKTENLQGRPVALGAYQDREAPCATSALRWTTMRLEIAERTERPTRYCRPGPGAAISNIAILATITRNEGDRDEDSAWA